MLLTNRHELRYNRLKFYIFFVQGGAGMSEHIVENNPQKEFMFALGGVGLFLAIVLLIGVSAFLRPAGQHIAPEAPVEEAAAAPVAAVAAAPAEAAPAKADAAVAPAAAADSNAAPVAAEPATATAPAAADKAATDAAAPAEKADSNADKTATAQ